jgi:hypothetical protein
MVDEVTHEEPAALGRVVDKSATRPRDRSALQASLGACRTLPKPEDDTALAAMPAAGPSRTTTPIGPTLDAAGPR